MLSNKKEIISYFKDRYLEQWINYFEDKKSTKSLWEAINLVGINQGSLSSLYSYHKSSYFSREKHISEFVEIQNIKKIMATLNIKDEEIEKSLPEAMKIYEKEKHDEYNYAYAVYRKKI